jgi:hypothetical protein
MKWDYKKIWNYCMSTDKKEYGLGRLLPAENVL